MSLVLPDEARADLRDIRDRLKDLEEEQRRIEDAQKKIALETIRIRRDLEQVFQEAGDLDEICASCGKAPVVSRPIETPRVVQQQEVKRPPEVKQPGPGKKTQQKKPKGKK